MNDSGNFRVFSPRGAGPRLSRLRRSIDGVAAVEFALLLPLMALLFFGSTEITQAVMASRKASLLARTLSDLVSQRSGSIVQTGCVTTQPCMDDTTMATIFGAANTVMAPFSTSTTSGGVTTQLLKATVSAVEFVTFTSKPPTGTDLTKIWVPDPTNPAGGAIATSTTTFTTSAPGYEAKVRWSTPNIPGGTTRTCAALTPSNASGTGNLPTGLYAPGSLIIADVQYNYIPPFSVTVAKYAWSTNSSSNPLQTNNTTYMRPRNTTGTCNSTNDSWICYPTQQTAAAGSGKTCGTY